MSNRPSAAALSIPMHAGAWAFLAFALLLSPDAAFAQMLDAREHQPIEGRMEILTVPAMASPFRAAIHLRIRANDADSVVVTVAGRGQPAVPRGQARDFVMLLDQGHDLVIEAFESAGNGREGRPARANFSLAAEVVGGS